MHLVHHLAQLGLLPLSDAHLLLARRDAHTMWRYVPHPPARDWVREVRRPKRVCTGHGLVVVGLGCKGCQAKGLGLLGLRHLEQERWRVRQLRL